MDSEAGRVLVEQAKFLLERLNDFDDWSRNPDELLRDWCGHVDPARSRLASTVSRFERDLRADNGLREALERAFREFITETLRLRNAEKPGAGYWAFENQQIAANELWRRIFPTLQHNTGERDDG